MPQHQGEFHAAFDHGKEMQWTVWPRVTIVPLEMSVALETLILAFEEGLLERVSGALFLGAEYSPNLKEWELIGHQVHRGAAARWELEGLRKVDAVTGEYAQVLCLPGKARNEVLANLARSIDHVSQGGIVVACLPNTAGGPRFEKELRKVLGEAESFSKNKCRVFWGRKTEHLDEDLLAQWRALGETELISGTEFRAVAGVFSADRIDPGSAFLAEHLPKRIYGRVADLGAGWGYLSHELLRRCPGIRSLDLYESDVRALDCARANVKRTEKVEPSFHWHDVEDGIEGPYDSIVMNPPFHKGIATDVSLGRGFLRTAHGALKRGGELYLVANRQLPYEGELDELGMRWRKQAENETFKLLFAAKR